jgi:hypothetical protein
MGISIGKEGLALPPARNAWGTESLEDQNFTVTVVRERQAF